MSQGIPSYSPDRDAGAVGLGGVYCPLATEIVAVGGMPGMAGGFRVYVPPFTKAGGGEMADGLLNSVARLVRSMMANILWRTCRFSALPISAPSFTGRDLLSVTSKK